jgi:hypothetical protein
VQVQLPKRSLDFSIDLIFQLHYGRGVDPFLTEMSTRNLPGGEGGLAHKADVTVICEPTS